MKVSPNAIYNWYRQVIRNPKYRWWVILGTLAYFVFPFDLLPDVIPIVGQLDDAVVMTLLLTEVYQLLMSQLKGSSDTTDAAETAANPSNSTTVDVDAVSVDK